MDALHAVDAQLRDVFRFMDLAPELRNCIYECALVQNRMDDQVANTALLRVCKKVQREATGIFWSQATFCLEVSQQDLETGHLLAPPILEDSIGGDLRLKLKKTKLDTFTDIWPLAILRVPRIEVVVDTVLPLLANHVLYALSSALRRSTLKTQDLSIKVVRRGFDKEPFFEACLAYPLLRMPTHLRIFYQSTARECERKVREIYLETNNAKKARPSYLTFDGAAQMEGLRPKIDKLLLLPHEAPDSQGTELTDTDTNYELSFIQGVCRQVKKLLEYDLCANHTCDRILMAAVLTLARWVEMKEAGISVGEDQLVELRRSQKEIFYKNQAEAMAFKNGMLL